LRERDRSVAPEVTEGQAAKGGRSASTAKGRCSLVTGGRRQLKDGKEADVHVPIVARGSQDEETPALGKARKAARGKKVSTQPTERGSGDYMEGLPTGNKEQGVQAVS